MGEEAQQQYEGPGTSSRLICCDWEWRTRGFAPPALQLAGTGGGCRMWQLMVGMRRNWW